MAKKTRSFSTDKQSVDAIISTVMGVLSLLVTMGCILESVKLNGNGPRLCGFLEASALVVAITGFVFGIISLKDEDAKNTFKRIGIITNFVAALAVTGVVLAGYFL